MLIVNFFVNLNINIFHDCYQALYNGLGFLKSVQGNFWQFSTIDRFSKMVQSFNRLKLHVCFGGKCICNICLWWRGCWKFSIPLQKLFITVISQSLEWIRLVLKNWSSITRILSMLKIELQSMPMTKNWQKSMSSSRTSLWWLIFHNKR